MSQSPHRMLSQLGLSGGAEEYTVDGMSTWIAGPHELSQWLIDQNGVIVTAMLVPAVSSGTSLNGENKIALGVAFEKQELYLQ
jgi:hypothetical protein